MSDDPRTSEKARREQAQRHRGQVIPGSGKALEPRRVPQMVSVRLDPAVLGALRNLASGRGTSVSDLLREGAEMVLTAAQTATVYWRFSKVEGYGLPATAQFGSVASASGFWARTADEEPQAASG